MGGRPDRPHQYLHDDIVGAHWQDLEELLPIYRAITHCQVLDGRSTSFWHDRWLTAGRVRELFPLLYSHTISEEISVAQVLCDGLDRHLVPRLTRAAASELDNHLQLQLLWTVSLRDGADRRHCSLAYKPNNLHSCAAYKQLMGIVGSPPCDFATFVWKNRAPPRIQFFAWLLVRERIQ